MFKPRCLLRSLLYTITSAGSAVVVAHSVTFTLHLLDPQRTASHTYLDSAAAYNGGGQLRTSRKLSGPASPCSPAMLAPASAAATDYINDFNNLDQDESLDSQLVAFPWYVYTCVGGGVHYASDVVRRAHYGPIR